MNNHTMHPGVPGIPLHCNICPKKPDFSDVSHLLTHIGSKAHLSHYFKMKVTAASDPMSKRTVDQYDQWYDDWNVQELMSERYDQKERKKSGASNNTGNSRRTSKVTTLASTRSTPAPTNWAGRRAQMLRESTLDPQLGTIIKQEPKSRSGTPASGYALDAATFNRSYAPPMQNWPPATYVTTPIQRERPFFNPVYSTTSSDSGELELRAPIDGKESRVGGSNSSFALDADDDADFDNEVNDSIKLKGIIWPGMDLFDSATPDMRRKRNQKKAFSVVRSLQATSEVVEATEQVFDAEGVLKRERPITGNPEEEDGMSPLRGESIPEPDEPLPKKKPGRRPRPALTEKNVNTGRVLRNRHGSHRPPVGRSKRSTVYYDSPEDDEDLTYGGNFPRRKNLLRIHRDNSGPEISFDHPAPFDTLTSGFRSPVQGSMSNLRAPYQHDAAAAGHRRQPSFSYDPGVRASQSNPFGIPPPNFGTFGQLSGSSMFQSASFHQGNPFPMSTGSQAAAAFQPQYTMSAQSFGNDTDLFQSASWGQAGAQSHNPWDFFGGFAPADAGSQGNADVNFQLTGDFAVNPLFISSTHAAPEDDEATVSPPSEHS